MAQANLKSGVGSAEPIPRAPDTAVAGDGRVRCAWAASNAISREYHDLEWGLPVRGETALLERISLEAFQSGLSWITILRKRTAFREAFLHFDADAVASFTDSDVDRLMENRGIVRHRRKIDAVRTNARATIGLRAHGGLDALVWSFTPERTPLPHSHSDVPSSTAESLALSKELRRRGFTFVGPTTMFALMEAIGMVDTHLLGCYRRGASGLWTASGLPAYGTSTVT